MDPSSQPIASPKPGWIVDFGLVGKYQVFRVHAYSTAMQESQRKLGMKLGELLHSHPSFDRMEAQDLQHAFLCGNMHVKVCYFFENSLAQRTGVQINDILCAPVGSDKHNMWRLVQSIPEFHTLFVDRFRQYGTVVFYVARKCPEVNGHQIALSNVEKQSGNVATSDQLTKRHETGKVRHEAAKAVPEENGRQNTSIGEPPFKRFKVPRKRRSGKIKEIDIKEVLDSSKPRKFSKHDEKWKAMYEELVKFKEEHKHMLVPQDYKPNRKLGRWVHYQRVEYWTYQETKRAKINPYRITKLNELGFIWDPQNYTWNDHDETSKQSAVPDAEGHALTFASEQSVGTVVAAAANDQPTSTPPETEGVDDSAAKVAAVPEANSRQPALSSVKKRGVDAAADPSTSIERPASRRKTQEAQNDDTAEENTQDQAQDRGPDRIAEKNADDQAVGKEMGDGGDSKNDRSIISPPSYTGEEAHPDLIVSSGLDSMDVDLRAELELQRLIDQKKAAENRNTKFRDDRVKFRQKYEELGENMQDLIMSLLVRFESASEAPRVNAFSDEPDFLPKFVEQLQARTNHLQAQNRKLRKLKSKAVKIRDILERAVGEVAAVLEENQDEHDSN